MIKFLKSFDEFYLQTHPIYSVYERGECYGTLEYMGTYEECLNYLNMTKEKYDEYIKYNLEKDSYCRAPYYEIEPFTIENFTDELRWNNQDIIQVEAEKIEKRGNDRIYDKGYQQCIEDYKKVMNKVIKSLEDIKKDLKNI